MGDKNPFTYFEEAFEKGLSGNVKSFNIWLDERDIKSEKLNYKSIEEYFLCNPKKAIIFEKELQSIAELLGYYSKEKNKAFSISLIGISGIGKSFFVKILKKLIEISKFEISSEILDLKYITYEDEFDKFINIVNNEKIDLFILDSCDFDPNFINGTFKRILNGNKRGVIISLWNPEFYFKFQSDFVDLVDFHKEFFVNPFNNNESCEIMKEILKFFSAKFLKSIDRKRLSEIYSFTRGIPKNIILFLNSLLELQFNNNAVEWDKDLIEENAKRLGFIDNEIITNLSDIQKTILHHILASSDPRGLRPSNLIDPLGVNKATVSYHLSNLKEYGLIVSVRNGRSVFYTIKSILKPYIQLQLLKEGEFNA